VRRSPYSAPGGSSRTRHGFGLDESTPLWLYILKEAHLMRGGQHLGPVGGRIVGEVILGLLQLDPDSYVTADPRWRPRLPTTSRRVTGDFPMIPALIPPGVGTDQRRPPHRRGADRGPRDNTADLAAEIDGKSVKRIRR
jgi:hypothetical protein